MTKHYAAVDVETTGLNPHAGDKLLQVAAYVTTLDYEPYDEGVEFVIRFSEAEVSQMREACIPFVDEMHEKTGLWDKLSSSPESVPLTEADAQLAEYFASFSSEALYMLGNSITLDRNFMEVFLPEAFALLHYQSVDVTSVRLFLEQNRGKEATEFVSSTGDVVVHEAKADILRSLEQVRFYNSLI